MDIFKKTGNYDDVFRTLFFLLKYCNYANLLKFAICTSKVSEISKTYTEKYNDFLSLKLHNYEAIMSV